MEIQKGAQLYCNTRVVTFVARFHLENRTPFRLAYLQHFQLADESTRSAKPNVILAGAETAFHWPRADLDQLLCIRVEDIADCLWSGRFGLVQDRSFHINMRASYGRSVFIRLEVAQRGATYHVIFCDAADYPPPFKLENLSQVRGCGLPLVGVAFSWLLKVICACIGGRGLSSSRCYSTPPCHYTQSWAVW